MPGRNISTEKYRFSINGQEKSTEIAPSNTNALYWEFDSRIARRWNLDPKPTVSISQYSCYEGNPIWNLDKLGDSIDPKRTRPVNVFIVPIQADNATAREYRRLVETGETSSTETLLLKVDYLGKHVSDAITKYLGDDGYINTLVVDFHRSDYDKMDKVKQSLFYEDLSKGYTGEKTSVLLGMCWSGGGPSYKGKDLPDLTLEISKKLDKAIVYGLRTEAASLPFSKTGNFGVYNPAYMFDNSAYGKNERKNVSVWTISKYDSIQKKYTSEKAHKTIILNLQGNIDISEIGSDASIPKYEYGRIM